jgi:glycerol-3-phosphate cytidylyltransferase
LNGQEKKYKLGYTQGVYDMFHIGHLHIINSAAAMCEKLIVGVNSDELVEQYKNKKTVISQVDRAEIVRNLKSVDECVIVDTLDKVALYQKLKFDAVFIGDDWKGNERWLQTEKDLAPFGVDVVYLPHTPNISSTMLRVEVPRRVDEQ